MGVLEPVNVYEAKTQLSRLIDRALAGEDVVIARSGRPLVRLVPVGHPVPRRAPGSARGQIHMTDDFDELPAELAAAFRGELP
ncbi:type II toxin-antitoxin system Phd/YefM family antitoxin [Modestobacter sp. DSM 44400]|uniref:type II toxin-antitoxin system Phd/YefM family antitoxin n=1 Tax=Modestobacter sp. DSM 44400 TaxID=1550230 RepID=UPI0020C8C517|nr:type II toxin-antitoxin system prevent-host-death family antitoxin [Modestobacter sp. DSM 44400]